VRVLRKVTKCLFGGKETTSNIEKIVDGVIIQRAETGGVEQVETPWGHMPPDLLDYEAIEELPDDFVEPEPPADDFVEPTPDIPAEDTEPWSLTEDYLTWLKSAGRADRTIQEYTWDLNWWNRHYPLNQITRNDIEKRIADMHPNTARRKIAVLRSLAKWQLRDGITRLHTILGQITPPKVPRRVPKDRGTDEFKLLVIKARNLCQADDRRGIWLGLMLCCGLRISEIQTAELANENTIRVIGKGNKERLLPAPTWLRDSMAKEYNYGAQWRKKRHLIWKNMKAIKIFKPHSLRHTFASELIRKGFPLEEVKLLLGHSKLDTTLIYAKVKLPENVTERLGVEN